MFSQSLFSTKSSFSSRNSFRKVISSSSSCIQRQSVARSTPSRRADSETLPLDALIASKIASFDGRRARLACTAAQFFGRGSLDASSRPGFCLVLSFVFMCLLSSYARCSCAARSRTSGLPCVAPNRAERFVRTCALLFPGHARRKRQLCLVLLPQGVSGCLGHIAKLNPNVAAGRSREVFAPDLLEFLREVGIDAVGIECKRIRPLDLGGFQIDKEPSFLADGEPLFACCFIIH